MPSPLRGLARLWKYPYWSTILRGVRQGKFPIFIDYPFDSKPRFGWEKPTHAEIDRVIASGRDRYAAMLQEFHAIKPSFCEIALKTDDPAKPEWDNEWFSSVDAAALYYLVKTTQPRRYVEIGSGNSTKFARQAIVDHQLPTHVTCIDPAPRVVIDQIADELRREPLEAVGPEFFADLTADDILFLDSSHRCFMGSDVTTFFLEILPKLPTGILIHVHDVHLPYDYPSHLAEQYWSEQYLVAMMLLSGANYEVVWPSRYVVEDEEFQGSVSTLFDGDDHKIPWKRGDWRRGASFWMRKLPDA